MTPLDVVRLPQLRPLELLGLQLHALDAVRAGEAPPLLLLYQLPGKVISIGRYHLYGGPSSRGAVAVYRRLTGGRIINPGSGWMCCSLIIPSRAGLLPERDARLRPEQVMNRYARGAMAGLRAVGVDCFYPGRDAITCRQREIAMCTFEENGAGALLFELFIAVEDGLDSLPMEIDAFDPDGRLTCPMYTSETCTHLARELRREIGFGELAERLEAGYGAMFGGTRRRDRTAAETIAAHNQASALAHWLEHRNPEPALSMAGRLGIQLGTMEVWIAAAGERIQRIAFYGDFIADSAGLAGFEQNLAGQRLDLMTLTAAALETYADGSHFILGCGDLGNLARLILKAI
jgi:hypothetical protein